MGGFCRGALQNGGSCWFPSKNQQTGHVHPSQSHLVSSQASRWPWATGSQPAQGRLARWLELGRRTLAGLTPRRAEDAARLLEPAGVLAAFLGGGGSPVAPRSLLRISFRRAPDLLSSDICLTSTLPTPGANLPESLQQTVGAVRLAVASTKRLTIPAKSVASQLRSKPKPTNTFELMRMQVCSPHGVPDKPMYTDDKECWFQRMLVQFPILPSPHVLTTCGVLNRVTVTPFPPSQPPKGPPTMESKCTWAPKRQNKPGPSPRKKKEEKAQSEPRPDGAAEKCLAFACARATATCTAAFASIRPLEINGKISTSGMSSFNTNHRENKPRILMSATGSLQNAARGPT